MACIDTMAPFDDIPDKTNTPFSFSDFISGYMFTIFLYSIAFLFFCIAAFTLVKNLKGYPKWILLASAVVMFSISTVDASISMYILFGPLMHKQPVPYGMVHLRQMFYFLNNLFADALLTYRCYVIWSHSVRIIILPCIILASSFGLGVLYVSSHYAMLRDRGYNYMWLALAHNILVTALIATRIWWMARQARKILGPTLARRYYSAMVIIIESGAIYSLYVLADEVVKTINPNILFLDAGLTQITTIAPTLIIVKVGLGRQAHDLETTIQTGREMQSQGRSG